jgi:hypothetical protein
MSAGILGAANNVASMSERGIVVPIPNWNMKHDRLGIDMNLYHLPCKADNGLGLDSTAATAGIHACRDQTLGR